MSLCRVKKCARAWRAATKGLWQSLSKSETARPRLSAGVLLFFALLFPLSQAACARPRASQGTQEGQPQSLRAVPLTITTASGKRLDFHVELAQTADEQAIGLMYRKSLAPDAGMIFPMRPMRQAAFWMANTYIPLDILFIAPGGRIESIAANATPLSLDPIASRGPVVAVLELGGGVAAASGIAVGDKVAWEKP